MDDFFDYQRSTDNQLCRPFTGVRATRTLTANHVQGCYKALTQIAKDANTQLPDHADAGPHQRALTYNADVNEEVTPEPIYVGTGTLTNKTPR